LVDHTTSSPNLAIRIAEACSKRGVSAIDAPVSGGDIGAREARLVVMCGGDQKAFDVVKPVFEKYATNIKLMGESGKGQHTKMAN